MVIMADRLLSRFRAVLLWICLLAAFALPLAPALADAPSTDAPQTTSQQQVIMRVFWGSTCPYCLRQKPFLAALEKRYDALDIQQYEIYNNPENRKLFALTAQIHGVQVNNVPAVFVGGRLFTGDSPAIRQRIEAAARQAIENLGGQSPASDISDMEEQAQDSKEEGSSVISVPFLGSIDMAAQPLVLSTFLIAFVDGFNPCSLWILMLLMGLVIHSGSRKRVMMVGLAFLLTTATIYAVFIAGVFKVMSLLAFMGWIKWIVALFALVFGLVNIKDFFWFKKGFSFTIADEHKPGIYKSFRSLNDPKARGLALIGATIVMAAGIAIVELPCTAGFPVIWSGLIHAQEVGWLEFSSLLLVYLLVYLLDEVVVFLTAVFTLKIGKFDVKHGQALKLFGGLIMIALALMLVLKPDMMNDISGMFVVFAGASGLSAALILARKYLTRKK